MGDDERTGQVTATTEEGRSWGAPDTDERITMHPDVQRHRKTLTFRQKLGLGGLLLATLMLAAFVVEPGATADSGLSPLELAQVTKANCQVALAHATTSGQKTWAQQCINAQTAIIAALTASPSPSGSPSPSPSATVSPSPSPTVPPSPSVSPTATTPPATTPPAPSPSPSPTVGPQLDCLHQLLACGFPDGSTTGVQPGITLAAVSGDVTLSTAGQVYENKTVAGCILVTATGVTIRNVKVTGDCFYSIDTSGAAYSTGTTTIEHVEIACPVGHTAIGEKHLAVRWVNIHGCENGFDLDGDTSITDSWLHDLLQDGNAHTDGIQTTHGSSNIVVRHNVIDSRGNTTSAMITDPDNGTTNVTIADNILAGGAYTLYCRNNSLGWSVTNNRFVMGAYGYTDSCGAVPVWSGNVVDATGATVNR